MTKQIGIMNFDNEDMQPLWWDGDSFTFLMLFFHICFSIGNLTDRRDDQMILMARKDDDRWSEDPPRLCWTCMNPKVEKAKNAIGKTGEAIQNSPK